MGPVRAIRRVVGLVALGALLAPACAWNPDVARPVALNAAAQSSKIFAADGSLVTTLHAEENRETVPLDNIAPTLRDAVVAIEDRRFWEHGGVDLRSLLRLPTATRPRARSSRVARRSPSST